MEDNQSPAVIAQIDVNVDMDEKNRFLMDYHTCYLCGTELEFTHVTNFVRQETVEEACCPSCKVQTKKQTHRLQ